MTDDNLRDALQGMRQPEPGAVWIKDVLAYVEPELNRLNIYIENQREPWQAKVAELEQENARLRAGQAELPPDPGNLPARMAEVIASHEWTEFPRSAHNQHNYYGACAVCQRDIRRIAEVALGVRDELVAHLSARVAAAEARVGHAEAGAELSSERLAEVRQELAAARVTIERVKGRVSADREPHSNSLVERGYRMALSRIGEIFWSGTETSVDAALTAPAEGTTTPARETA